MQRRDAAQQQKVQLEEKHFRRIDKYGGEVGKWQEWLFAVCVAVGGVSRECVLAMEEVVKKAGTTKDLATLGVEEDIQKKFGAE